jgi:hypothetical protein
MTNLESWWRTYRPTTKWYAASAATVGTIIIMFWTGGGLDSDDKRIVLVGLVVSRVVAYITRNDPGPPWPDPPPAAEPVEPAEFEPAAA